MNAYLKVDPEKNVPKYLQLAQSVKEAIRCGRLKRGQRIYSINAMSDELFLSRDTVERAYDLLRRQNIISSVHGKGFYIKDTDIDVPLKVLLLFNKISNYKKQIYHAFIQTLGKNAVVDLKIHHSNVALLKELVEKHLDDYNYFVIMPHFYDDAAEATRIIQSISPEQLFILDKKIPYVNLKCGAVYQDFENDIVDALEEGLDLLKKYEKLVLVHSNMVPYPREIITGFRNFCLQNRYKFDIILEVSPDRDVHKGEAYIVIEETDLANLIKACHAQKLQIGKQVGIVSYNETPLKEILLDGLTVLSTDHAQMGETAARMILENSKEKVKNPFTLIKRKSL